MTRLYKFRHLMLILTSPKLSVMKQGERYFFAQIVD